MSLSFDELRKANVERCNKFFSHTVDGWSGTDWGSAVAGEFGEVADELHDMFLITMKFMRTMKSCDTLKKMRRQLDDDKNFEELRKNLAKELADVVTYADLLAAKFDIDLGKIIVEKFNEVSKKRGADIFLGEKSDSTDFVPHCNKIS